MGRYSRSIFFVCAVLLMFAAATPSHGQEAVPIDHPLFTSPVREADAPPVDLQHVRLHFAIDPIEHLVRGELFAEIVRVDSSTSRLAIPVGKTRIENIQLIGADSLNGEEIEWSDARDTVFVLLPATRQTAFGITMEFYAVADVHSRPLGRDDGPWTAVWTPFHRGVPAWLGIPASLDDRFSAELRVTVPPAWTVILTGEPRFDIDSDGIRTVGSWVDSGTTVSQLGFVAVKEVSFAADDRSFFSISSAASQLAIDEAMISIARMDRFFGDMLQTTEVDLPEKRSLSSTSRVLLSGPMRSMSSGAGLTILPSDVLPDGLNPIEEDFDLALVVAHDLTESHVRIVGWTDVWIQEALATFMAAQYVRNRHGEAAYMHVMWSCRQRYLDESTKYARPLVWDRWDDPEDMLDEHAACKGAWLLHMLSAGYDVTPVWTGLRYLIEIGEEESISSEELRLALEQASGKDLSKFFDQWVYSSGHPRLGFEYQVAADQASMRIDVQQVQEGYLVPSAYTFDVDVEAASLAGIDRTSIHVDDESTSATINVELRPQSVRLDPFANLLFEHDTPQNPSTLISSLRRQESAVAQYVAARQLESTRVDASLLIGLRPILAATASPLVERSLLRLLSSMAPSATALRELLAVAQDTTSRSQAAAIAALAPFTNQPDAKATALRAANSSANPLMLASAVEALVQIDSTLAWRVLQSAMVTESKGDIVRRTAVGLIPFAPAVETEKLSMLLTALSNRTEPRIQLATVSALRHWSETTRVRSAVLAVWAKVPGRTRSVILDFVSQDNIRSSERDLLERWKAAEPSPTLRRRLTDILGRVDP